MNFFARGFTARVLPKGVWSVGTRFQDIQYDQVETSQGGYTDIPSGQWRDQMSLAFAVRYGWQEGHDFSVILPFQFNNYNLGGLRNKSKGLTNVTLLERWQIQKETNTQPAAAVDFSYFLPTGAPDRLLGGDDDAYRVSVAVSKAWKEFSLHANPGYTWNKKSGSNDVAEFNAGLLLTPSEKFWFGLEYNYVDAEGLGHSHDLVPGLFCIYGHYKVLKLGVPINLDSTLPFRDRVGLIVQWNLYF